MTDSELKKKGVEILVEELGPVEGARFISLILRGEPFDYTEWQRGRFDHLSVRELSALAMESWNRREKRD
jgi:hypothetical protein